MKPSEYTKLFLYSMNEDISTENIQKTLVKWWHNSRDKDGAGLRLTTYGYLVLRKDEFEFHRVDYSKDTVFDSKLILFLDKFLDCPFFINEQAIFVMSSKKAVELSLLSGDIRKYGDMKEASRQKKDREKMLGSKK